MGVVRSENSSAPFVRLRIVGHGPRVALPSMTNVEVIDPDGAVVGQLRVTDWWAHGTARELPKVGVALLPTDVELVSR
jgi:hypothetical protein